MIVQHFVYFFSLNLGKSWIRSSLVTTQVPAKKGGSGSTTLGISQKYSSPNVAVFYLSTGIILEQLMVPVYRPKSQIIKGIRIGVFCKKDFFYIKGRLCTRKNEYNIFAASYLAHSAGRLCCLHHCTRSLTQIMTIKHLQYKNLMPWSERGIRTLKTIKPWNTGFISMSNHYRLILFFKKPVWKIFFLEMISLGSCPPFFFINGTDQVKTYKPCVRISREIDN